jgi:hypothetical protein
MLLISNPNSLVTKKGIGREMARLLSHTFSFPSEERRPLTNSVDYVLFPARFGVTQRPACFFKGFSRYRIH